MSVTESGADGDIPHAFEKGNGRALAGTASFRGNMTVLPVATLLSRD